MKNRKEIDYSRFNKTKSYKLIRTEPYYRNKFEYLDREEPDGDEYESNGSRYQKFKNGMIRRLSDQTK